jgi:cell division protein FtsI/penicillin-binding protein 2
MHLDLTKGSRPRTLAILTLVIMAVFVVRLFYMQIIQHGYYVGLANSEQLKQLVIPAKRGEIYAMNRDTPVKLVLNETVYTVFADPKIVDDPEKVIDVVRRVAGGNVRTDLAKMLSQKESRYQILATKVSRKQAELIKKEGLSGIGLHKGYTQKGNLPRRRSVSLTAKASASMVSRASSIRGLAGRTGCCSLLPMSVTYRLRLVTIISTNRQKTARTSY